VKEGFILDISWLDSPCASDCTQSAIMWMVLRLCSLSCDCQMSGNTQVFKEFESMGFGMNQSLG